MPRLKHETELARSKNILDAAQKCFARKGFHSTSMQDICKEAVVSPGAVYVYFDSKEALIAGLCERDRAELTERLEGLTQAPDFLAALSAIGQSYFVNDPVSKQHFVVEMGLESTRNARIAEIFLGADGFCNDAILGMFRRLKDEGRIDPTIDLAMLTQVFLVIGDGLFWRRAVLPKYDVREVLPVLITMIGALVRPIERHETQREAVRS